MAISKEEKNKAIRRYSTNAYWKAYYDDAPSALCKEYVALHFCASAGIKRDEANKEMDALETRLSKADWAHLYQYAGNNPFGAKCKRNMK